MTPVAQCTGLDNMVERPLGNEHGSGTSLRGNADALATEVERNFSPFLDSCEVGFMRLENRLIERIGQARLQCGVDGGEFEYIVRGSAIRCVGSLDFNDTFGQSS